MSQPPNALDARSVLVVDDDAFALETLRVTLGTLGLGEVHTASDGVAALRWIKAHPAPPDILICDVYMPNMDGLEFLDKLAQQGYKGMVIVVSGVNIEMLDMTRQIARTNGLRVEAAFVKPVSRVQLAAALGLDMVD